MLEHHHPVIELAKKLISIQSITPDDQGCQQLITDFLQPMGFKITDLSHQDVTNTLYSYGTGSPHFIYIGHTDVVPPGPIEKWQHAPFSPTIDNNILYGRGAADMKGSIAAILIAIKDFLAHPQKTGTISILLTSDEEGEAKHGIKHIAEHFTFNPPLNYCLIGEASAINTVGDTIKNGRKGSLHCNLKVIGKQGHIAFPERAINPIHTMLTALNALTQYKWDLGCTHFTPTTCQIYRIQGGEPQAENIIPQQAECWFNFRFNTSITIEEIKEKTKQIFDAHKLNYNLTWKLSGLPSVTKSGKFIALVKDAIKKTTDLDANLSCAGGTSDARFLTHLDCEILELGAVDHSIHQIDEHIDCKQLITLSEIYRTILQNIFHV